MQLDLGVQKPQLYWPSVAEAAANPAVYLPDPSSQFSEEQEDQEDVMTLEQLQEVEEQLTAAARTDEGHQPLDSLMQRGFAATNGIIKQE